MGTPGGWETRRRRQAERDREWEESIAAAARKEEKERLLPLLKVCEGLIQELEPAASFSDPRPDVQRALADLRAQLGEEAGDA